MVDDSQEQRVAAEEALKEHEVIVCDTFTGAAELLNPRFNEERYGTLLVEAGLSADFQPFSDGTTDEQNDLCYELRKQAYDHCDLDVVLTDLMMPAERGGLSDKGFPFVGKPVPYGFAVALHALKAGVERVAIVSNGQADDGNHHNHPILYACDQIEGVIVENRLSAFVGYRCPHMSEEKLPNTTSPSRIKDWAEVLNRITGVSCEEESK